ncbi:hypothetical protein [Paenibacillus senegalensis]|uniref:hypothetical protein n=1 Tax=Paenibacillus senegalensis TaxID=1465766 RepID=UPI00031C5D79|nr:hypothetical protein [Paenibacillus senegalensis]
MMPVMSSPYTIEPPCAHNSLLEDDLECFVRCAGCYYRKCGNPHQNGWRQAVQHALDQVVRDIYSLPAKARTMIHVRNSMERHWPEITDGFLSSQQHEQYRKAANKYMMLFLTQELGIAKPFYLCQPVSVYVDELGLELTMMQQVVEWQQSELVIRKYISSANVEVVNAYSHLSVVFAHKVFQQLPSRIEVYSVLTGKTYEVRPGPEDLPLSIDYLRLSAGLMKEDMDSPRLYQ